MAGRPGHDRRRVSFDALIRGLYDRARIRRELRHTCGGVAEWLKAAVC